MSAGTANENAQDRLARMLSLVPYISRRPGVSIAELAREFNRANPDHAGVFYQSYTSVMSSAGSHRVLSVPYRVIKALGDENDGLVTVDSAKWGEFRGVFRSTSRRGVSHGDLVDMDREDYAGFNVLDTYLKIVAELKERGF